MERFGLVGLPNAVSHLYITRLRLERACGALSVCDKDPNIGMAKVLDPRLDALAEMSKTQKIVYARSKLSTSAVWSKAQAKVKVSATSFLPTFAKWMQLCLYCGRSQTTIFRGRVTRSNICVYSRLNSHSPTSIGRNKNQSDAKSGANG